MKQIKRRGTGREQTRREGTAEKPAKPGKKINGTTGNRIKYTKERRKQIERDGSLNVGGAIHSVPSVKIMGRGRSNTSDAAQVQINTGRSGEQKTNKTRGHSEDDMARI